MVLFLLVDQLLMFSFVALVFQNCKRNGNMENNNADELTPWLENGE